MNLQHAVRLSEKIIKQWDEHDRYRVTDSERSLFDNGQEPDDVVIARALCSKNAPDGWEVSSRDDLEGEPVGWTILAIGDDGSVLCRSPSGRRARYWFVGKYE